MDLSANKKQAEACDFLSLRLRSLDVLRKSWPVGMDSRPHLDWRLAYILPDAKSHCSHKTAYGDARDSPHNSVAGATGTVTNIVTNRP
jgi:hypothetical protein